MRNKLYIIGNGFDLHHEIASSYKEFGEYLKNKDSTVYRYVEEYFDLDGSFWFEFEERLASFDQDALIDNASMFLASYGSDDWSDSHHHAFQLEIDMVVKAISSQMKKNFVDWVQQLKIPAKTMFPVDIDSAAKFLNFNYTSTLQKIYKVPERNILHIHGNVLNSPDEIVLGHGWEQENFDKDMSQDELEDMDVRVYEGLELIDDYFKDTFKPVDKIIGQNQSFFSSLSHVDEILIMGHSLSEVDNTYFYEIIKNIDKKKVRWKISYHQDATQIKKNFSVWGIDNSLIKYNELKDF